MAFGSIDFATVMPRTVEAGDLQGRELSQIQHAADQTANQFQQKVEQDMRQPVEAQKSETEEFDKNGSGKNAYMARKRKSKKKKEEQPVAPRSQSKFDIMI